MDERETLRCSIWDPTGNITALVESPVPVPEQPAVAAALMRRCPAVEQVGFVTLPETPGAQPKLRMAGGEFCGNASMSAAALSLLRCGETAGEQRVSLRVSGVAEPVAVHLRREGEGFRARVRMPAALAVGERLFAFEERRGMLPMVRMEGISHLLIEPGSVFFPLLRDPAAAGQAVRVFCETLGAEGLGLMFLEQAEGRRRLTPLVYIPGSGTEFWENSCASGSSAVGMLLAARQNAPVGLTLTEPGGTLRVESDPGGETWLSGRTRLLREE